MTAHEDRNEIRHPRISEQVLADPLELLMDNFAVERLELARNIGLCLLHSLREHRISRLGRQGPGLLIAFGRPILTQPAGRRQASRAVGWDASVNSRNSAVSR